MKSRVLIVGENQDFLERIRQQLDAQPALVALSAASSDAGLELALQLKPHLILIDASLAHVECEAFCRRLRRDWETRDIPLILFLEPDCGDAQALMLNSGAEGYIRKPVHAEELLLKVRSVVKRRHADSFRNEVFDDGCLFVDPEGYLVRVHRHELKLTFREFSLLRFLIENRGRVFSRDKLLQVVWERTEFHESRTVDVHIRRIRAKLGHEAESYIKTIVGVGYLFSPPSHPPASPPPSESNLNPGSGQAQHRPAKDGGIS